MRPISRTNTALTTHCEGLTLVEVLVAMAIFALIATFGWRGIDGMRQAHERTTIEGNRLQQVTLALEQWQTDLNALVDWPADAGLMPAPAIYPDWNGQTMRWLRAAPRTADGWTVVIWGRVLRDGQTHWTRWQSTPSHDPTALRQSWEQAARALETAGVALLPMSQWQVHVHRQQSWVNPQSSTGSRDPLQGVRLMLDLPQHFDGPLTLIWTSPRTGGGKS